MAAFNVSDNQVHVEGLRGMVFSQVVDGPIDLSCDARSGVLTIKTATGSELITIDNDQSSTVTSINGSPVTVTSSQDLYNQLLSAL
jgi:hypothetical protein